MDTRWTGPSRPGEPRPDALASTALIVAVKSPMNFAGRDEATKARAELR